MLRRPGTWPSTRARSGTFCDGGTWLTPGQLNSLDATSVASYVDQRRADVRAVIYSITKPVISAAFSLLAAEGVVNLETASGPTRRRRSPTWPASFQSAPPTAGCSRAPPMARASWSTREAR